MTFERLCVLRRGSFGAKPSQDDENYHCGYLQRRVLSTLDIVNNWLHFRTVYTIIHSMKVKDVMNTTPVSLAKNASIYDVWKVIYKKRILALPIVDGRNNLLGIISFSDLLKKIFPGYDMLEWDGIDVDIERLEEDVKEISHLKAENIMKKRVYTIKEDVKIISALSRMIVKQVHQLPVTDDKNRLIGMIYKTDIFDALFTKYLKK